MIIFSRTHLCTYLGVCTNFRYVQFCIKNSLFRCIMRHQAKLSYSYHRLKLYNAGNSAYSPRMHTHLCKTKKTIPLTRFFFLRPTGITLVYIKTSLEYFTNHCNILYDARCIHVGKWVNYHVRSRLYANYERTNQNESL